MLEKVFDFIKKIFGVGYPLAIIAGGYFIFQMVVNFDSALKSTFDLIGAKIDQVMTEQKAQKKIIEAIKKQNEEKNNVHVFDDSIGIAWSITNKQLPNAITEYNERRNH